MESIRKFLINLGFEEKDSFSEEHDECLTFRNKNFGLFMKYYAKEKKFDVCIYDSDGSHGTVFFSERLLREFVLIKKHEYEECCFLNFVNDIEHIANVRKHYSPNGFVNNVFLDHIQDNITFMTIIKRPNFLLEIYLDSFRFKNNQSPKNTISSKDNSNLSELKDRITDYLKNSNENAFEGFFYESGVEVRRYP